MGDYANRKFPTHTDAIQTLGAKNTVFREVCGDYEEICAWLAAHDRSAAVDPTEWSDAQNLKRDLEGEILKLLEEHNDLIS